MVPEGWYLVQHFAQLVELGTKHGGTGTKPISFDTNNNFINGCFWNS